MSKTKPVRVAHEVAEAEPSAAEPRKVVLVGTYKGSQLTDWSGWYNYPVSDNDKITTDDAAQITELWLFNGTRKQRTCKAAFVGIKTCLRRKALVARRVSGIKRKERFSLMSQTS